MRLNHPMDPSSPLPEPPLASEETPLSLKLSEIAARALGCLLEKELATPDAYPLTLNGLVNACNQRSNRDPIMSLTSAEAEAGLDELRIEKLAVWFSGADSRVPKFKHKLDQVFGLNDTQRGILAELLLRGPQTAAQLRANAQRLAPMPETDDFEGLLTAMSRNPAGALLRKLPRQLGKKEARWAQLLTGEPVLQVEPEPVYRPAQNLTLEGNATGTDTADLERRVSDLECMVNLLQEQIASMQVPKGGTAEPPSAQHPCEAHP
ncbi:MAG: DUF480 domain-containing protein [Verrucomicrobia bacterium]|nr:DUF480 domain-containing protein [Verrucomicrobiota bacterium]